MGTWRPSGRRRSSFARRALRHGGGEQRPETGTAPVPARAAAISRRIVPSCAASSAITQNPQATFDVIVQGDKKGNANGFYKQLTASGGHRAATAQVRQQFNSINGVEANLTGKQILSLAKQAVRDVDHAERDGDDVGSRQLPISNPQLWPYATGASVDWTNAALPKLPTIAVVDSGIQPGRADFGSRVLGQVNLAEPRRRTRPVTATATARSSRASRRAPLRGYAGVAPKANLVSLDVMNDQGEATVADVLKACDWILANKSTYNIRVANFSLHAVNRASFMFDPLDQAVEKLWLNGVVVVAASGNYGSNGQAERRAASRPATTRS